jgi:GNAT superfamily N-acetyltransferase
VHDRRVPAVRRCPPTARDVALATVVAAFATDPLLRWVWPDDARYAGCAPAFFGLLLDLRLESGEVWVAEDGAAVDSVAMWDPPGGLYQPPPSERWTAVQQDFTDRERAGWATYEEAMGVPAAAGPHWYLGVLATAPGRQGTGLGRAVTAPMLAAADRTGLPAYLETASETNVAIYRRLGFDVDREVDMPDGGPRCWLMLRAPQEVVA